VEPWLLSQNSAGDGATRDAVRLRWQAGKGARLAFTRSEPVVIVSILDLGPLK